jgi:hypothetical protein
MSLKIVPLKTSKDKIKQPALAEQGMIPKINSSTIFSGRSGSGKSVCLANLLTRKEFLKGAFDQMYLISPTGTSDDIQKQMGIKKANVFTDVIAGITEMEEILNDNRSIIEKVGADKAPKILLIYDDCVGDRDLLKHPMFIKSFIACRHFNCTTMICTQSFTRVPRVCRLQATNTIIFACSLDEVKTLSETYCPSRYTKREFSDIIHHATREPYSFLYVNWAAQPAERYRKNFDTMLKLDRLI